MEDLEDVLHAQWKCGKRIEMARWNSENWTYIFNGTVMAQSSMWRNIKQNWMELIQDRREEGDFVAESEEDARRSGTDGDATSGGDEETRAWPHRWNF